MNTLIGNLIKLLLRIKECWYLSLLLILIYFGEYLYSINVDQQLGIDSSKGSSVKPDFTSILNATTKTNMDILLAENNSLKREIELLKEINDLLKGKK